MNRIKNIKNSIAAYAQLIQLAHKGVPIVAQDGKKGYVFNCEMD